jgi:hypothetical protein
MVVTAALARIRAGKLGRHNPAINNPVLRFTYNDIAAAEHLRHISGQSSGRGLK